MMDDSAISAIQQSFTNTVEADPEISIAFAAIKTLLKDLETHEVETLAELMKRMKELQKILMLSEKAGASVSSGTELFLRFITLASLEYPELRESRRIMIERGKAFLRMNAGAREKIARVCGPFIMDDMTLLTHSRSRAVRDALIEAKKNGKNFRVFVTESCPDHSGEKLQKELSRAGISCTLVLDAAVAYVMERVDCVLVGAEGVVENGGIINKIGNLNVAMCAHAFKRPLYVLAECIKFVRLYPLSQQEVPNDFKYSASRRTAPHRPDDASQPTHPLVDYTPPRYITLLFTDLGVLTPAAVSEQLIQLYM
ncbi:translation initiation factor eIF-2B subunit alpha-like [Pollicipes pollicipes]|uniref:translation initiation factor eIF-2B subunit alpha-like n=1 Tax=Pollicipes pollicipes TaxID=41117 RepID=UPI0018852979|nr:translation initiation factor eIF-2B subunit alpha-like [Pollicipes pollicipes]XP_037081571.1 translation initiation factor eIF-2B subunit alpha-like [Pollicipes pollicipes]XP_037081572.1 translation initiation factor eIF-2B subunit alpha-like [Pollicipes pollicipes]